MDTGNPIIRAWLERAVAVLDEHAAELNELDRQIGDGDHGSNMLRGFRAALTAVNDEESAAENVRNVGMALVSNVGGASGPLFGTYFLRMAGAWRTSSTTADVAAGCRLGLDAVMARGKAQPGDATMVDALLPALESLEASARADIPLPDALTLAATAAEAGAQATAPMLARRGRAAQFGEASIGHLDPGAVSAALLWSARNR